ncbi:MAG TPA: PQQ-binding-like beta-propeller repeat protein, partial [Steroidobacteraceae bacterium]|nr:PQQ-binding-like beta-propeller repeat protein [Steroidobacteraceae bacterium]
MQFRWFSLVAAGVLCASFAPACRAQYTVGDWPMYRHNLAGDGFSPLRQINTHNVADLKEAWTYQLAPRAYFDPRNLRSNEVTPIVVKGVMYLPAGSRIVALDADSGKEVWSYDQEGAEPSTRGVAYWPGDAHDPPRIIVTTFDKKVEELDAATGKPVPGFGDSGVVTLDVGYVGVPTVFGDIMYLGATVGEVPVGPPGDTRALDIRTGRILWVFHTVPRP